MNQIEQSSAISVLQFEEYLGTMPVPQLIPDLFNDRRNPLNESFEDRCEIRESCQPFLNKYNIICLSKIERYIFNNLLFQKVLLFKKNVKNISKTALSLALLYKLENLGNKKIILIFQTEARVKKYITKIDDIHPGIKKDFYTGAVNSMIINDKRACQKNYKLMSFPISRFINLLNQKNLDLNEIDMVLFIEISPVVNGNIKDLETFLTLYNSKKRSTCLGFIDELNCENTSSYLSGSFGNLFTFENRQP